jgi:hypothetical protein
MANRQVISARFRIALANRLKTRFGKVLSAQRFSDLYNLNAYGSSTISRETARLWIRGNAMPDYGHLAVLIHWLGINPEEFLGNENPDRIDTQTTNPITPAKSKCHAPNDLITLWGKLEPETRRTLLLVAKALSAEQRVDRDARN